MRKLFLVAGAATLALSMPAIAEKGGKGGGNGGGKGQSAQGGGGGGGKPQKMGGGGGQAAKAQRQAMGGGDGGRAKAPKTERQAFRGGGKPAKAERQIARGGGGKPQKAERQAFRASKPAKAERDFQREVRRSDRAERSYVRTEDIRRGDLIDPRSYRGGDLRSANYEGNCPPGLAKKNNGCMAPGQVKKAFGLGDRVQQAWFGGYNVPAQYSAFYQDTPDQYFRYGDEGYIYRVDSRTDMISGLVPLLGGGFSVGQPLPAGYDVYNVPYQYRDDYYDTDESYYRYGDEAIYEVDPQSGMIESIVALLGGDLNVGQQLPSGYDAYNVPLDYRDEYQDTDENMYRYADGNIYEVDTKTQIIQAIVQMLG